MLSQSATSSVSFECVVAGAACCPTHGDVPVALTNVFASIASGSDTSVLASDAPAIAAVVGGATAAPF